MDEIKINSHVKWTSQSGGYWREKVGTVLGIVPGDDEKHMLVTLCGPIADHKYQFGFHYSCHGSYIYGSGKLSYLVSVKTGKTDKAKRTLYRPRQVELCEPDDKRDGVYPGG